MMRGPGDHTCDHPTIGECHLSDCSNTPLLLSSLSPTLSRIFYIIKRGSDVTWPQLISSLQRVNISAHLPTIMACVNIKQLLRSSKTKQKQNQDYIYLQWHFMTSAHSTPLDRATYDNVDIGAVTPPPEPEVAKSEEVSTRFSDIRLWLASQPESVCTEIYCDCCDPAEDDLHYSCVDVASSVVSLTPPSSASLVSKSTSLSRRQNSISSISSTGSSMTSTSSEDLDSEESFYSNTIRQKSKSIFKQSSKVPLSL